MGAACATVGAIRLWELADTARLAECAADRRIDQYLHSPIAAAGPKHTVELQMLSNRRLVGLLQSTLLLNVLLRRCGGSPHLSEFVRLCRWWLSIRGS